MHTVLLTQTAQNQATLGSRLFAQLVGHQPTFLGQLFQQRIKHAASQIETGLQRLFHPHVKPRFDTFGNELHRYRIDQHAG